MNKSAWDCSRALYREVAVLWVLLSGMQAAGFVLTGGESTRMGQDKALLSIGDIRLVQTVANALRRVSQPVTLVGKPERYHHLSWACLTDLRPGSGPMSGLETALTQTQTEWNLIAACDMPDLSVEWLRDLVRYAQSSSASCVATRDADGRIHPLCAVYRTRCLPIVNKALDENRLRLTSLLDDLETQYLQAPLALPNLNTPSDWEQYRSQHAGTN